MAVSSVPAYNTTPSALRSRKWCFTLNNPPEVLVHVLDASDGSEEALGMRQSTLDLIKKKLCAQFVVFQYERGAQGTPHRS